MCDRNPNLEREPSKLNLKLTPYFKNDENFIPNSFEDLFLNIYSTDSKIAFNISHQSPAFLGEYYSLKITMEP